MAEEKMDIRQYKEFAKGTHGEGSINNSMLEHMDRATGGKKLSRQDWDQVNAKIKIKQAEVDARR